MNLHQSCNRPGAPVATCRAVRFRHAHFVLWLALASICIAHLTGCSLGSAPQAMEETASEEPAAPVEVLPTQAAIAPPTETPTEIAAAATGASPTPMVVEAAAGAPEAEALGRLDIEYPVQMEPLASDTVILELSVPELLVAAEPMAVTRVERAEPVTSDLGRFDAVVYLAPRMQAELTSPGLEIELLSPADQDVVLHEVNVPTMWAWTVLAPDTPGKQVMTLRLYRSGEDAPLWIGSLRVDVLASRQLESALSITEDTSPPVPTATPTPEGLAAQIVDALTQNVTSIVLGILGLIGTIAAAFIAARAERSSSKPSRKLGRGRRPKLKSRTPKSPPDSG